MKSNVTANKVFALQPASQDTSPGHRAAQNDMRKSLYSVQVGGFVVSGADSNRTRTHLQVTDTCQRERETWQLPVSPPKSQGQPCAGGASLRTHSLSPGCVACPQASLRQAATQPQAQRAQGASGAGHAVPALSFA